MSFGPSTPSLQPCVLFLLFYRCVEQIMGIEWTPLLDPHFAQEIHQETTIHSQSASYLLIQLCYSCLYSTGIPIAIILFQAHSLPLGTMLKALMKSSKQQYNVSLEADVLP